jgi:nitroreductase
MDEKERHGIFINLKRGFLLIPALLLITAGWVQAQELKPIKLMDPDKKGGMPLMEALSLRASVRSWSDKEISRKDLSNLLWAADGINRPDGKRTAASAADARDIDVYVFMKEGIYLYNAADHVLNPVISGDYRNKTGMPEWIQSAAAPPGEAAPRGASGPPRNQDTNADILILLVSDIARIPLAPNDEVKLRWAAMDAAIVYQNIALFCASAGLSARPRALLSEEQIRGFLKLTKTQYPMLNIPVGYAAE